MSSETEEALPSDAAVIAYLKKKKLFRAVADLKKILKEEAYLKGKTNSSGEEQHTPTPTSAPCRPRKSQSVQDRIQLLNHSSAHHSRTFSSPTKSLQLTSRSVHDMPSSAPTVVARRKRHENTTVNILAPPPVFDASEDEDDDDSLSKDSFHEDLTTPSSHRRSWTPKRVVDAETYKKENPTAFSGESSQDDVEFPQTPSPRGGRSWKPKRVVDAETYNKENPDKKAPNKSKSSPTKKKKQDSTPKKKPRGRLAKNFEVDESSHSNGSDLSAASTGLEGRVKKRRSRSTGSLSSTIHVTRQRTNRDRGAGRKKKLNKWEAMVGAVDEDDGTASTTPVDNDSDDLPAESFHGGGDLSSYSFHCGGNSDSDSEDKPKRKLYKVKRVIDAETFQREKEPATVSPKANVKNRSIATRNDMDKSPKEIIEIGTIHEDEEIIDVVPSLKDRIGMFNKNNTVVQPSSFLSAKHMKKLVPVAENPSSQHNKKSGKKPKKSGKNIPVKTAIKRGLGPRQPSIQDLLPPPTQSLDVKKDKFVRKKIKKTESFKRADRLRKTRSALLGQKSSSKKDVFVPVSAKPTEDLSNFKLPEFTKDPESLQLIKTALRGNFVFDMKDDEIDNFVKAFEQVVVGKGDVIIKQGDPGDYFYVVGYGTVSFHVNGKKVGTTGQGKSFGEMSLLYTCPRAASAIAETPSTRLFRVDQKSFRFVMQTKTKESQEKKEKLLREIPFLKHLSEQDLHRLSSVMTPCLFQTGDYIVKRGERGDSFYVIQDGKVRVTDIFVGNINYEDVNLEPGDYFGEGALITSESRAASVVALTKGTAFAIDRATFQKVLGDFVTLVSRSQDRHKLEGIKIFRDSNLTAKNFDKLASHLKDKEFKANKKIFKEGDKVDGALYIVREGHVTISTSDGSRSEEVAPGGYFGQEQLLADAQGNEEYAKYTAKAGDDGCVCGVLSLKACRSVFNTKKMENSLHAGGSAYKQMKRASMEGDFGKNFSLDDLNKERMLGDGQHAEVWLVSDKSKKTNHKYALKIQNQDAGQGEETAMEAFRREIMVLQQLHHPFIIDMVKSFDTGDGFLYMMMEVVTGGELWSRIHREEDGEWVSGMKEDHAKFYALALADALAYIHREKFVFRDLKPENVLMDTDGYPKIVDFGYSRYCPDKTYTFCGTPNYLAPEMVKNQGHGVGVDHWALGVVLYEMITGENPFYFEDMGQVELFQAIVQEDFYPLPDTSNPDMVDFITELLEKEPAQRLGVLAGQESDILRHKWFAGVDLEKMRTKEAGAPWKPA